MPKAAIWLVLALGVVGSGCERRAPNPEQCLRFAQRWYRLTERPDFRRESREGVLEELTLRCLTQPFEPEFVGCVNRSGSIRACHPERFGHIVSTL